MVLNCKERCEKGNKIMIFADVLNAVDHLSAGELRQLRERIAQREQQTVLKAGTVDMEALLQGLAAMRAGLSEDEFREIERAMRGML